MLAVPPERAHHKLTLCEIRRALCCSAPRISTYHYIAHCIPTHVAHCISSHTPTLLLQQPADCQGPRHSCVVCLVRKASRWRGRAGEDARWSGKRPMTCFRASSNTRASPMSKHACCAACCAPAHNSTHVTMSLAYTAARRLRPPCSPRVVEGVAWRCVLVGV